MSKHKRHKKKHKAKDAETQGAEAATKHGEHAEEKTAPVDPEPAAAEEAVTAAKPAPEEIERQALIAQADEMRSLAQRTRAEFENYRKRVERERAETIKYAAAGIIKEILPVLDNLERAVQAASQAEGESAADSDQLREGVAIITKQFRETLAKQGLSEVEAEGVAFDPHVHEAVHRVVTSEHPEGTIVEVLQKGYKFKDRLIRPSMVTVAQSGAEDEDGSTETERENEDEAVPQRE